MALFQIKQAKIVSLGNQKYGIQVDEDDECLEVDDWGEVDPAAHIGEDVQCVVMLKVDEIEVWGLCESDDSNKVSHE